jgi:hypothetical protein
MLLTMGGERTLFTARLHSMNGGDSFLAKGSNSKKQLCRGG